MARRKKQPELTRIERDYERAVVGRDGQVHRIVHDGATFAVCGTTVRRVMPVTQDGSLHDRWHLLDDEVDKKTARKIAKC